MDNVSLSSMILSEDYLDVLVPYQPPLERILQEFADYGAQYLGGNYVMLHIPRSRLSANYLNDVGYSNLPKLYTTLDTVSLEQSGILPVQNLPGYAFRGKDVLIGFLDTGISYAAPAFRTSTGTTRILGIWDQTIQGNAPFGLGYGTGFTREQIDEALALPDPLSLVGVTDEEGHGTFLASVAAGSPDPENQFTGAAPECDIAMVKLKPAKENLKNFFLIPANALAFQETDLMMGIRYLELLAAQHRKPLVICIGLGTNQGDHSGSSPMAAVLNSLSSVFGVYPIVAAGNEAGRGHHFYGKLEGQGSSAMVEILSAAGTAGFSLELWAQSPELYSVSIFSPSGESIPAIPPRLRQNTTIDFVLEKTVIHVNYEIVEVSTGNQLIILRFENPTEGIWSIRVTNESFINGVFHMWLPISGFLPPETQFLAANPETTLTEPSSAAGAVTVSTWDTYTGSLYIHSSRGFTRTGAVKPDLAAPGVGVTGTAAGYGSTGGFRYRRDTGSSIAAAITSGAVALLVNWEATRRIPRVPTAAEVRNLLIRGAVRDQDQSYPNQYWGYGKLNLYGVFQNLI